MLLHKKELQYKKLLKLDNRRKILWQQRAKIAPIKLEKPIFNGYVAELALREETLRRPDGDRIKELIQWLGQDKAFCRDKSFIRYNGKNKTILQPSLHSVGDPRFCWYPTEHRRNENAEKILKYNKYLRYHNAKYLCGCENELFSTKPHYVFRFPWMLETKISEHYLTHYFPVDGEIESELTRIHDYLYVNDGKLYGKYKDDREFRRRYRLQNHKFFFCEEDVDNPDFRW